MNFRKQLPFFCRNNAFDFWNYFSSLYHDDFASDFYAECRDDEGNDVSDEQKKKNKEKAEEILKQAKEGVDFAQLAKEHSQDGSSENGGDLDFFSKGQMVEPFEKAAFSLKNGEIYPEIVETDYGYHIIKKTDEKYDDFDTIKEELVYTLEYEKPYMLDNNNLYVLNEIYSLEDKRLRYLYDKKDK